jgi:hypothetical protein
MEQTLAKIEASLHDVVETILAGDLDVPQTEKGGRGAGERGREREREREREEQRKTNRMNRGCTRTTSTMVN